MLVRPSPSSFAHIATIDVQLRPSLSVGGGGTVAALQMNALRAATTRFPGFGYYVSFVRRPEVRIGFLVSPARSAKNHSLYAMCSILIRPASAPGLGLRARQACNGGGGHCGRYLPPGSPLLRCRHVRVVLGPRRVVLGRPPKRHQLRSPTLPRR